MVALLTGTQAGVLGQLWCEVAVAAPEIDKRLTVEQSVRVVGWAEAMRTLADEVGSEWNPPGPNGSR